MGELVTSIAECVGIRKSVARACVGELLSGIAEALASGDNVEIEGFGVFKMTKRAPRIGRDLNTGKPIVIPERMIPKFTPSKRLIEDINKGVYYGQQEA